MELIEILKEHAERYPLMTPCDVVKLIYQNEFGGGHLIKDAAQSLLWIQNEYASLEHEPTLPLFESIGNGMIRVNLAAIDTNMYPLEKLNEDFVRSSEKHQGTIDSFIEKLNMLCKRFDEIGFSFPKSELTEYLSEYERAGYPMVSHSEVYRETYHPAYRVIER